MSAINLHVVGCPRSGTTLMAEMLMSCYEHNGGSRHEETIFKVPYQEHGLRISKKPNDILWVLPLLKRDPNLHVIALIRDPRSVVCSVHKGWPGMYFCNYPVWKRAERALSRLHDHPRVEVVYYENLVLKPMEVQTSIEEAFPFLSRRHDFDRFHEVAESSEEAQNALGGVRAMDASRLSGWKDHLPRLKQQVERHPGLLKDLVAYGYEKDSRWLALLDGVQAKTFPCRYSDSSQFLKHLEMKVRFISKRRNYFRSRGL